MLTIAGGILIAVAVLANLAFLIEIAKGLAALAGLLLAIGLVWLVIWLNVAAPATPLHTPAAAPRNECTIAVPMSECPWWGVRGVMVK